MGKSKAKREREKVSNAKINEGASTSAQNQREQEERAHRESMGWPEPPDPKDKVATLNYMLERRRCFTELDAEDWKYSLDEYENKFQGPDTIDIHGKIYQLTDEVKLHCAFMLQMEDYYSQKPTVEIAQEKYRSVLQSIHRAYPLDQVLTEVVTMSPPSSPAHSQEANSLSQKRARSPSVSPEAKPAMQKKAPAFPSPRKSSPEAKPAMQKKAPAFPSPPKLPVGPATTESTAPQAIGNAVQQGARPKPLMVMGLKPENLKQFAELVSNSGNGNFELKPAGRNTRLHPTTFADKLELIKILDDNNVNFYVVPDRRSPLKVVLGGLEGVSEAEIKEALTLQEYDVIEVKRMKSRKDGSLLPLFLVQLVRTRKAREILNLKTLFHIRIRITPFRASKKATQCFRCQGFNHVAVNCHADATCAAGCEDSHETRDCPLKSIQKEERPDPVCCHCKGKHLSSFKGCDLFPNRKSYAQAASGSGKSNKPSAAKPRPAADQSQKKKTKAPPTTTTQQRRQLKPAAQEVHQLYELREFSGGAARLSELIHKIKDELAISSFDELANSLEEVLQKISGKQDALEKKLCFLDSLVHLSTNATGGT